MSKFKRQLDGSITQALAKHPFFKVLENDIKNGEVFPAIRNNSIDFYYKGGKLFGYDSKGFYTHKKFAGVMDKTAKDYVYEKDILSYHPGKNLEYLYEGIKEYCSVYSRLEALGVSAIYGKYSFYNQSNKIAVLDIEIAFEDIDNAEGANIDENKEEFKTLALTGTASKQRRGTDRIDMLLLDRSKGKKGKLRFVEAKHYTNAEIKAGAGKKPNVVAQISRYDKQLKKNEKAIISQYENYCSLMNSIFSLNLPEKLELLPETKLFVFGFDKMQKNDPHLKKLKGKNVYMKGSVKSLIPNGMKKFLIDG